MEDWGEDLEVTDAKGDPRTYAIIGAAMEVHRQLGRGFAEPVYQEALGVELKLRGIAFEREVKLPIIYRGTRLEVMYRADFLVDQEIIVEAKALTALSGTEASQILNYLKASNLKVALLLNFGTHSLYHRRLALCQST